MTYRVHRINRLIQGNEVRVSAEDEHFVSLPGPQPLPGPGRKHHGGYGGLFVLFPGNPSRPAPPTPCVVEMFSGLDNTV